MANWREYTVDVRGQRVSVAEAGSGLPVLLLHGNSACKEVFQVEAFASAAKRNRLIAIDLPGHGRSADAEYPARTCTIPGYASLMHDFICSHVNAQSVVVVGWSLGGHIAVELLARAPMVSAVMAIGAPPANLDTFQQAFQTTECGHLAAAEQWADGDAVRYVAEKFGVAHAAGGPFLDAARRADGRARSALFQAFFAGEGVDQRNVAETVDRPLAIVCGERDQGINLTYLSGIRYVNLWYDKIHVIQGAGHACFLDRPRRFSHLLNRFLAATASQRSTRFCDALKAVGDARSRQMERRVVASRGRELAVELSLLEWEALIAAGELHNQSIGDILYEVAGDAADVESALRTFLLATFRKQKGR
ncbi:MAG: alpha/beta hydrolase [Alphaproteobacteria bacterium]|nr:alpha/beta hydrolase [Alphaproteobacteria bacterium]